MYWTCVPKVATWFFTLIITQHLFTCGCEHKPNAEVLAMYFMHFPAFWCTACYIIFIFIFIFSNLQVGHIDHDHVTDHLSATAHAFGFIYQNNSWKLPDGTDMDLNVPRNYKWAMRLCIAHASFPDIVRTSIARTRRQVWFTSLFFNHLLPQPDMSVYVYSTLQSISAVHEHINAHSTRMMQTLGCWSVPQCLYFLKIDWTTNLFTCHLLCEEKIRTLENSPNLNNTDKYMFVSITIMLLCWRIHCKLYATIFHLAADDAHQIRVVYFLQVYVAMAECAANSLARVIAEEQHSSFAVPPKCESHF